MTSCKLSVAPRLVFIKSYQTLFIKFRKRQKRGKSCLISFLQLYQKWLILELAGFLRVPTVLRCPCSLSSCVALWCDGANSCLCCLDVLSSRCLCFPRDWHGHCPRPAVGPWHIGKVAPQPVRAKIHPDLSKLKSEQLDGCEKMVPHLQEPLLLHRPFV